MSRGFWVAMGLVAAGTLALWALASPAARSASREAPPAPQLDRRAEYRTLVHDIRRRSGDVEAWGKLLAPSQGASLATLCSTLADICRRQADKLEHLPDWPRQERLLSTARRWALNAGMVGKHTQRSMRWRRPREEIDCTPPYRLALALNRAVAYAENHPEVLTPERRNGAAPR
ncbi:MAG: hypothetical protein ACYTGX_18495 [Planctomycetota bacterium]|jgi:hypothetical protein